MSYPAAGEGRSTAREGNEAFAALCLSRLPDGVILNLGAGYTSGDASREVLQVDIDPAVLSAPGSAAADAAALPFGVSVFDGMLIKDVLEHVLDPVQVLREARRVSRPGARIIVTVPRAVPRAVWADPTHLRGFTKRSLQWTLEMGGWVVDGPVRRMGSIPGAGRIPWLLENAHHILRLPLVGHRLGLNWLVTARRPQ